MTLSYLARLLCLSLAAFFLLHALLAAAAGSSARWAVRWAERMPARAGARWLFALRLLPAGLAALLVAGLCVPSYFAFEKDKPERVGLVCCAAALAALAVAAIALTRGLRAMMAARRYGRRCQNPAVHSLPGAGFPACVTDDTVPTVALTGLLRPKLVISRGVVAALSGEQLALTLRHEQAHWRSRDNLKRLALLLTPRLPAIGGGLAHLERGWERLSEWAADDHAVAGDAARSLALASALVRVARLGATGRPTPLATTLLDSPGELAARVSRLVDPPAAPLAGGFWRGAGAAAFAAAALVWIALPQTAALHAVHELLEHLVR